jgi:NAD-dependent deacetylase
MPDDALKHAAEALANTRNAVAVTGAGASVESGIPDFRSADGLWARYNPAEYATYEAFIDNPDKVWIMWYELADMLVDAKPNAGHYALARLEEMGILKAVITQNIDDLHFKAGNTAVIEYHGNAGRLMCPACHRRRDMDLAHRKLGAPRCECGGYMKPDVVLFGEMIPPNAMLQSDQVARTCDVLLIVGTSATVYPAAALPAAAKEHGAFIIECNTEETQFTHSVTDAFLQGPAGEMLPQLLLEIERIGS